MNNMQDTIDSRDVIERFEELTGERDDLKDAVDEDGSLENALALRDWIEENGEELDALTALVAEASGSPDWIYGETLIRHSYFKDYAQQLAEDCSLVPTDLSWPCDCIDWDKAARDLTMDYFQVDFGGVAYWIRS